MLILPNPLGEGRKSSLKPHDEINGASFNSKTIRISEVLSFRQKILILYFIDVNLALRIGAP